MEFKSVKVEHYALLAVAVIALGAFLLSIKNRANLASAVGASAIGKASAT
jgi:hypothetical protein